jgi:hypothetical protein
MSCLALPRKLPQNLITKIDGYRKRRKKSIRYVIRREAYNSAFASETQRALVTQWLIQKQRIALATPKATVGVPSPEPQNQFVWPDGKRRRSFEIHWPRRVKEPATASPDGEREK